LQNGRRLFATEGSLLTTPFVSLHGARDQGDAAELSAWYRML
jgi:hypothetical protein